MLQGAVGAAQGPQKSNLVNASLLNFGLVWSTLTGNFLIYTEFGQVLPLHIRHFEISNRFTSITEMKDLVKKKA